MTNYCYRYDVYNRYCVGGDPVKLNLYCRKRIRNRLFYRLFRGRMYWASLDVLHEIHEIHRTMEDTAQYRIHRIMHFMRIVCKVAKLEAPILAAFTALYVKALYCCALIAILNYHFNLSLSLTREEWGFFLHDRTNSVFYVYLRCAKLDGKDMEIGHGNNSI